VSARRASARAQRDNTSGEDTRLILSAAIDARELLLLRAKAAVCDAYRHWLVTTKHKERSAVSASLSKLRRLEQALLEREP
jgi:hypothetical protein